MTMNVHSLKLLLSRVVTAISPIQDKGLSQCFLTDVSVLQPALTLFFLLISFPWSRLTLIVLHRYHFIVTIIC